jgi:hypothetical protein
MDKILHMLHRPSIWIMIVLFIAFYPMLISIYVFLPLLIGIMGYLLMVGIDEGKTSYVIMALIYFVNLEVNLSLPFFLTIITSLLIYVIFYEKLTYLKKCSICKPILSVLFIDGLYLGALLAYDFMFQSTTVVLDNILLYSLIVDVLVVVIL